MQLETWIARALIGREAERELAARLHAPADALRVLCLQGIPGIGKTALMRAIAADAAMTGQRVLWWEPEVQASALEQRQSLEATVGAAVPTLICIDRYERVEAHLDAWLREIFLPALPPDASLLLASRQRLPIAWLRLPWRERSRSLELQPIAPAAWRRLVESWHGCAAPDTTRLAQGVPLALVTLGKDVCPAVGSFGSLLAQRLKVGASAAQIRAMQASALVPDLTACLLAAMLQQESAEHLFHWLSRQCGWQRTRAGLRPVPLLRHALLVDMRWQEPMIEHRLRERAATALLERVGLQGGQRRLHALMDLAFLFRRTPPLRGARLSEDIGYRVGAMPAHLPARLAGGRGSDDLVFAYWWRLCPECFRAVWRSDGELVAAFVLVNALGEPRDGGERQCRDFLRQTGGVADSFTYVPWWLDLRKGQVLSAPVVYLFAWIAADLLSRGTDSLFALAGGRASTSRSMAQRWGLLPVNAQAAQPACYVHDLRHDGVEGWLRSLPALLTDRKRPPPLERPTLPERSAFVEHVQLLLRHLYDDAELAHCPLPCAAFVSRARCPADATPAKRLRGGLRQAIGELCADPARQDQRLVMERTYLGRGGKQLSIAADLGMSYATYRRRLKQATECLTEHLWQLENQACAATGPDSAQALRQEVSGLLPGAMGGTRIVG